MLTKNESIFLAGLGAVTLTGGFFAVRKLNPGALKIKDQGKKLSYADGANITLSQKLAKIESALEAEQDELKGHFTELSTLEKKAATSCKELPWDYGGLCWFSCPADRDRIGRDCLSYVKGELDLSDMKQQSQNDINRSKRKSQVDLYRREYLDLQNQIEESQKQIHIYETQIRDLNAQGVYL
ncbi:MAG: hypothetical protein KC422_23090 [Trueperaceae bacterium]|nr:hypothetical protein [Trueperaceae bacterium]